MCTAKVDGTASHPPRMNKEEIETRMKQIGVVEVENNPSEKCHGDDCEHTRKMRLPFW